MWVQPVLSSPVHYGKYREIRLEKRLGKMVEPLEYEVAGFGLYSVGSVSHRFISAYFHFRFTPDSQHVGRGGTPLLAVY